MDCSFCEDKVILKLIPLIIHIDCTSIFKVIGHKLYYISGKLSAFRFENATKNLAKIFIVKWFKIFYTYHIQSKSYVGMCLVRGFFEPEVT